LAFIEDAVTRHQGARLGIRSELSSVLRWKAKTTSFYRPSGRGLGQILRHGRRQDLLAATSAPSNILRIEEKKDARQYHGKPDPQLYSSPRSANSRSAS